MNIHDIYYKIRPMARLHSGENLQIHPFVKFIISACFSLFTGFFGGAGLWFATGFNPDNSGGTFIFIFGAILTSLLSLGFIKNKPIFYGMNLFTGIVVLLLIISCF